MKKKLRMVLIVMAAGVLVLTLAVTVYMRNHQQQVDSIVISDVDISQIPDGVYTGRHEVFPVVAEVRVTVEDNRITDIQLVEHVTGQGAEAEAIPGKVVRAQSLQVDIVSGATSSSKVILKAIENALKSPAN